MRGNAETDVDDIELALVQTFDFHAILVMH